MTENQTAAPSEGQEVAPESATEEAKTQAAQASDGQESPGEPTSEAQQAEEAEKRVPRGVQKRIDKLTRELNEQRRLTEAVLMRAALGNQPASNEPAAQPPQRAQFDSYEAYLEAKTEYEVARRVEEKARLIEQKQAEQAVRAQKAALAQSFEQRAQEFAKQTPDFVELVLENDSLQITDPMADFIRESDVGPELAYHFGRNPDEAERIAGLSGAAQTRALARLESQVSAPRAKASSAPKPITPVGGRSSTANQDPGRMSMEEFIKLREKQGAKWARR